LTFLRAAARCFSLAVTWRYPPARAMNHRRDCARPAWATEPFDAVSWTFGRQLPGRGGTRRIRADSVSRVELGVDAAVAGPVQEPAVERAGPSADNRTRQRAYAFGTVLAVQAAVHLRGRRMLLLYASLSVIGSVLAALAVTPGLFIAGHILQGLTTSLMLIAAVPPLVIGRPPSKMPWTGATMNLCVFGAVALGPVIGGLRASAGQWRPLFWIVAGVGGARAAVRGIDLRGPAAGGSQRTVGSGCDRARRRRLGGGLLRRL